MSQHWSGTRISPRLLATYREGKNYDMEEYTLLPSFLLAYFFTQDLDLELEVGTWFRGGTRLKLKREIPKSLSQPAYDMISTRAATG